jgi:hypothetical protein
MNFLYRLFSRYRIKGTRCLVYRIRLLRSIDKMSVTLLWLFIFKTKLIKFVLRCQAILIWDTFIFIKWLGFWEFSLNILRALNPLLIQWCSRLSNSYYYSFILNKLLLLLFNIILQLVLLLDYRWWGMGSGYLLLIIVLV